MNIQLSKAEVDALYEAVEDRLQTVQEEQERDHLLRIRARLEKAIAEERQK
jgi:hypothetical protein